jgi:hypothetical protein
LPQAARWVTISFSPWLLHQVTLHRTATVTSSDPAQSIYNHEQPKLSYQKVFVGLVDKHDSHHFCRDVS